MSEWTVDRAASTPVTVVGPARSLASRNAISGSSLGWISASMSSASP